MRTWQKQYTRRGGRIEPSAYTGTEAIMRANNGTPVTNAANGYEAVLAFPG